MNELPRTPDSPAKLGSPSALIPDPLFHRERERLEQMRETFEAIPDAACVVDHEWRFLFANRLAAELTGRVDMVGHNIFEIFPGNREDPFSSAYQSTMQHRTVSEFEAFHVAPLNLWLRVLAKPYGDGIIVFFSDITPRKSAELREQEISRRLAQVLEVTSDAVASLDREWRYTYLNANAERLIDPERKLIGRVIWEEFPLAIDGPAWEIYHRSMDEGLPGYVETFYPEPINAWLALSSRPAVDGIVVFFQDISERKTHDNIVRGQLDLLKTVQTASRAATWEYDFASGTVTYGPGAFPICGHSLETLTTREALENILLPGQQERLLAEVKQALTNGGSVALEFAVHAPDRSTRWIESRGEVSQVEGRTRIRGLSLDVTQRHLSQAESERKRAELESVYATTPVGLGLLDPVHFTYLNLNEHEAAMLDSPRESLLGRPLLELAAPEKVPNLLRLLHLAAAGHTVRDHLLEGELTTRPGEQRAWTVNYTPIYNEDGSISAISTASLEITHQRRSEAALIQSEKLAAVGRLAQSISHEINNPLEAITNLLYLIALDDDLPEALKIYVHLAQSELQRVSQIATQTLRFHRQAVAPTLVAPADLVSAVIHLYTGRLVNSSIKVDVRYKTAEKILCLENDIRQVLNNLIANAIDAMRNGGRIIARAHATSYPSYGVRITIADTGHGMDEPTRKRIFEPFFTTKDLNGTGLGLWISHGIVERHQGRLKVRSSTDPAHHGTVFTLFLPSREPIHPPDA